jgi:hypothetical protein
MARLTSTSRAARCVALSLVLAFGAIGCTGDDTTPTSSSDAPTVVPAGAAVAATITALSAQLDPDESDRKFIVAPLYEGTSFSLEVQVEVVNTLAGVIDVQFIDDAAQALVDDGTAVVDDAILVRLALADLAGPQATLTGEHWESAESITDFTSEVRLDGETYVATVEFS